KQTSLAIFDPWLAKFWEVKLSQGSVLTSVICMHLTEDWQAEWESRAPAWLPRPRSARLGRAPMSANLITTQPTPIMAGFSAIL
ncbi:hypothetical protein U1Q18_014218, partial [Sarracenia purpurea var. burkii]